MTGINDPNSELMWRASLSWSSVSSTPGYLTCFQFFGLGFIFVIVWFCRWFWHGVWVTYLRSWHKKLFLCMISEQSLTPSLMLIVAFCKLRIGGFSPVALSSCSVLCVHHCSMKGREIPELEEIKTEPNLIWELSHHTTALQQISSAEKQD